MAWRRLSAKAVAVVGLAATPVLGACSVPGTPSSTLVRVTGELMGSGGPANPSAPNSPRHVTLAGVITARSMPGGEVRATTATNPDGSVLLHLAPGTYRFATDCGATEDVVLKVGAPAHFVIWCAVA
jgi:hypothetical protein